MKYFNIKNSVEKSSNLTKKVSGVLKSMETTQHKIRKVLEHQESSPMQAVRVTSVHINI